MPEVRYKDSCFSFDHIDFFYSYKLFNVWDIRFLRVKYMC